MSGNPVCQEPQGRYPQFICGQSATFIVRFVHKVSKTPWTRPACAQHLSKSARFGFKHGHSDYGVQLLDLRHPADRD